MEAVIAFAAIEDVVSGLAKHALVAKNRFKHVVKLRAVKVLCAAINTNNSEAASKVDFGSIVEENALITLKNVRIVRAVDVYDAAIQYDVKF